MQSIKLKPSPDGTTLHIAAASADLSARDVDNLIRDLAAARARMTPVVPAEPPDDPTRLHQSDNLPGVRAGENPGIASMIRKKW